ncbi:MAG: hypothetical protein M1829_004788 [Trizodia sp. TS-e1964]|nr:MAG: hypothetical protein M1829_004788 [Trizodia sp. TS-e1964]
MAFQPPPPPKTLLGRHRILSPTASVRVSPLCLGAMSFGDAWAGMLGACDKKTTFEILDYFHENGGNFVDTSNNYQSEQSETWIGEWMAARGVRDQMVIATKYTTDFKMGVMPDAIHANFTGNGTKSMHVSVRESLKKLQTDYIDLLYVHWWDSATSIPELMQALNQLVLSGKVLYLGVSDTPAWVVNARNHGMRQFSVYQGQWSCAQRDFERDIIPMARAEGMALAPWGALGSGYFKTAAAREKAEHEQEGRKMAALFDSPAHVAVSKVLERIAGEKGAQLPEIALAYVMHKAPYVFPICGSRKLEHLKGNIAALAIELSEQQIKDIEGAVKFDIGFPMTMLGGGDPRENGLLKAAGHFDYVELEQPIKPGKV